MLLDIITFIIIGRHILTHSRISNHGTDRMLSRVYGVDRRRSLRRGLRYKKVLYAIPRSWLEANFYAKCVGEIVDILGQSYIDF